jgi:AsmA-like C-terminal region
MVFSREGAMSAAEPTSSARDRKRLAVRPIIIGAMAILIVIAATVALFAVKWPFTQQRITRSLESALHGKVRMTGFHSNVFPHPGCVVEGFSLTRSSQRQEAPPLATADKLTIQAGYLELLLRPNHIDRIVLENLHVRVPGSKAAASKTADGNPQSNGQEANGRQSHDSKSGNTHVGEIIANNAKLTIIRSDGKNHLDFDVHSLILDSVGPDEAISYRVEMTNALPPGEISSHGLLGPWNTTDAKKTPLFGEIFFERANLAVFSGIAGSLSARSDFRGTLEDIDVNGNVDVPEFKVKRARESVHLQGHFRAQVNAAGDVNLERVEAHLLNTNVEARARIAGGPGGHKMTTVDFSVHHGHIQDVIALFAQDKPPLDGVTNFRAHTVVHAFDEQFLKETELQGEFEIADGRFTNAQRQASVDEISARAHSHKRKGKNPEVTSEFHGDVVLEHGIAHFSSLSMSVPAAVALMNGTYNLLNDKIDFHGTLRTQAEISRTTTGIKAVLLTPLDPFFKKKSAGAAVPVEMTGTYDNPQFAFVLASKNSKSAKKSSGSGHSNKSDTKAKSSD